MRVALLAQDEGKLVAFSKAAFHAYWGDLKDISQPEEIAAHALKWAWMVRPYWTRCKPMR